MIGIGDFILKTRRGQTPFYRNLKKLAKWTSASALPVPRILNPLFRLFFNLHQGLLRVFAFLRMFLYNGPLFRARCESAGSHFRVSRLPFVIGGAKIHIGNHVNFFGKVDIMSGGIFDEPRLVIGDRVDVGHNVAFVVNHEIVIEDNVNIASGARFMDSDSHPKDTTRRIAGLPPSPEEVKPIRVCRYAWIGQNAFILKGVTIGEGAVIGVNSVVVTDIPPYAVAMGNPARVVVKNASAPVAPKT
jgi:acetyltransferase-like isoleucine patch superfamily enzyme